MTKPLRLASLLLFTSALVSPALACAQTTPSTTDTPTPQPNAGTAGVPQDQAASPDQTAPQEEQAPDISVPGGDAIVVTGRRVNVARDTPQVVSVLSSADIARTGEGDIAGALSRVTGLSVVGNGYVYVRGLGDRYSLAMLNGSPLPSPEPLKRVVPLDIFPTNIVSSSLVQKSYSPNFPGEFGGGVINLTTNAVPKESFLTVSGGLGWNFVTSGHLGYVHAGGEHDWNGYDDNTRNIPPALAAFFASGERISSGNVDTQAIAGQLVNAKIGLVQKQDHIGPNWSATVSGGTSFDISDALTLGVIATGGYSNKWTTRDSIQQSSLTNDLSGLESDFERVSTDNRIVANALLGFGLKFDDSTIRLTNLYIHDTVKRTRLGLGKRHGDTTTDFMQQDTAWYERQLIDTQLVGEFKLSPEWSLDVRGSYANTKRKAPNELSLEYVRTNAAADIYGAYFVNRLNNGNGGDAEISYSDLNEDLYSASGDLTWRPIVDLSLTAGYSYLKTERTSSRRDFKFTAPSTLPGGVAMLRPDLLLGSSIIDYYNIALIDINEGNPAFAASLLNHAGYGKVNWQVSPELSLDFGVRYETAKEIAKPIQIFNTPGASQAATNLDNDYWLPAATLTWQFQPSMQVRLSSSKTVARPQFRELLYQLYFDPETNRSYQGNPFLKDSTLVNAEARYEWYFAPEQRFTLAGFFKRIKNPIEPFISGLDFTTTFANAPQADLYGAEVEAQKRFALANWGGNFFADRYLIAIANYTYTHSKLKVDAADRTSVFGASSTLANDYFRDGAPLTGQSDHLVNFQFGMEDKGSLSQQTFILSYASKRVTSRGVANSGQPDVYEYPGLTLDFVMRQGINVMGHQLDLKLEARNITNRKYKETQSNGKYTVIFNQYSIGPTVNFSVSTTF